MLLSQQAFYADGGGKRSLSVLRSLPMMTANAGLGDVGGGDQRRRLGECTSEQGSPGGEEMRQAGMQGKECSTQG